MMLRRLLTGTVAMALVSGPVAAQAAPAAADRTSSPVSAREQLVGSTWLIVAGLIAAGILIVVLSDDDDEEPQSP